jgi:hypothetical protein
MTTRHAALNEYKVYIVLRVSKTAKSANWKEYAFQN